MAAPTQNQTTHATDANALLQVRPVRYVAFLLIGVVFGAVLAKAELLSWYRIQEMFRFQDFHLYGVIGSAVALGATGLWLARRLRLRTCQGLPAVLAPKAPTVPRYLIGGTLFGMGWALTGACPGPVFALIGQGYGAFMVVLASVLLGTYTYGLLRERLPH